MLYYFYFVVILSISNSFHHSSWRCGRYLLKSQHSRSGIKILDNDLLSSFSKLESSPSSSLGGNRIIHRIGIDDIRTHSKLSRNLDIPEQFSTFGKSSTTFSPPGDLIEYFSLAVCLKMKINTAAGYDKVIEGRTQILSYLENPASLTPGSLPLGDKSSPDEIWQYFPGMSKGQFKSVVGVLLREGAIQTSPHVITLVPASDRVPMQSPPYSGKSPKGWRTPANCTLFLGNLPFSATDLDVAEAIERMIGYGKLATVKVSVDKDSGNSRGFGHVDFFTSAFLDDAMGKLKNLKVDGRAVRAERKKNADEVRSDKEYVMKPKISSSEQDLPVIGRAASSNSTYFSPSTERAKTVETRFPREEYDVNSWCTVYVGELPYKITDETLKFVIESKLSNGKGSIAAVRQAINKDTGLKRGFGYIDFHEKESAERAVKELNGMNVMGRAIKLDLEGMKKRRK